MEAPKKIYIHPDVCDNSRVLSEWMERPLGKQSVEYTRTDVFIKKACDWLKDNITNNPNCTRVISRKGTITMGELISDFKKYMEE